MIIDWSSAAAGRINDGRRSTVRLSIERLLANSVVATSVDAGRRLNDML
jgi:hypothetical protein